VASFSLQPLRRCARLRFVFFVAVFASVREIAGRLFRCGLCVVARDSKGVWPLRATTQIVQQAFFS
jgi:hypothetical protein